MKKKWECFVEWLGGLSIFISIISLIQGCEIPEEQWGWIIFCILISICLIPFCMFCLVEGLVKHIRLILKEEKEKEEKNNDKNKK